MPSDENVIPFPGSGQGIDPLVPSQREPDVLPPPKRPSTYVVRVGLDGASPPIWRRLHLASDLTLDLVHEVVQASMGWWDSHLHQFLAGPGERDHDVAPFLTAYDVREGDEGIPESAVRLDQVLGVPGALLHYTYDFGDGWDHTLRLEELLPLEDGPRARCVDGSRACPPEDVGGINRYNEVAEQWGSRHSGAVDPNLLEVLHWLPVGFDPGRFDIATADQGAQDAVRSTAELRAGLPANSALSELAARFESAAALRALSVPVAVATRGSPDDVDHASAVRPMLTLLDRARGEGTELTSAGRLRPAVVHELLTTLGWDAPWLGKGNREDSCPPIRHLRAAAQSTGLVRRHRGRLVLTPAGRRVAGDPRAIWDHVAARLPIGRHEWERTSGLLATVCVAQGDRNAFDTIAPALLSAAGWAVDDHRPTHREAFEWARPTWEVFWALADDAPLGRGTPPHVAALARAALVSDPAPDNRA